VVRKVPLDNLFVETDSPYLTPVPHRGKRNEPAYVRFVAETVASVKHVSLQDVADTTTRNVKQLFRI
jgi:TatD DNase family protein